MPDVMTETLRSEYETIIASLGEDATDDAIIVALFRNGDRTEKGATEVLRLA